MPVSKREKLITLAKSSRGGKVLKEKVLDSARDCVDKYQYLYVISLHNERNSILKDLRVKWKGEGTFLFAKNRVICKALEGYRPGLENLRSLLKSDPGSRRGIFLTNANPETVKSFFDQFKVEEFARSGAVAEATVKIPQGPLQFPFSLETTLRSLGMKTKLEKGSINLLQETVLCTEGEILTPEQCRLLKLFGIQSAQFHVQLHSFWHENEFTDMC